MTFGLAPLLAVSLTYATPMLAQNGPRNTVPAPRPPQAVVPTLQPAVPLTPSQALMPPTAPVTLPGNSSVTVPPPPTVPAAPLSLPPDPTATVPPAR